MKNKNEKDESAGLKETTLSVVENEPGPLVRFWVSVACLLDAINHIRSRLLYLKVHHFNGKEKLKTSYTLVNKKHEFWY